MVTLSPWLIQVLRSSALQPWQQHQARWLDASKWFVRWVNWEWNRSLEPPRSLQMAYPKNLSGLRVRVGGLLPNRHINHNRFECVSNPAPCHQDGMWACVTDIDFCHCVLKGGSAHRETWSGCECDRIMTTSPGLILPQCICWHYCWEFWIHKTHSCLN